MNKTELRRAKVKAVVNMLVDSFGANIEDADGGRMDVLISGMNGQFSRRDFDFTFFDSIKLFGEHSEETIARHKKAVQLEDIINKEIEKTLEKVA